MACEVQKLCQKMNVCRRMMLHVEIKCNPRSTHKGYLCLVEDTNNLNLVMLSCNDHLMFAILEATIRYDYNERQDLTLHHV